MQINRTGRYVRSLLGSLLLAGFTAFPLAPSRADTAFILEYQPDGFDLDMRISLVGPEPVFEREPDYGSRRIVRGTIPAGRNADAPIGFVWDEDNELLYLDRNRNLDLTDDPDSPIRADASDWGQFFPDITLYVEMDGHTLPYQVSMRFQRWSGHASCTLTVLSGWTGGIELNGQPWMLAFADNMNGQLGSGDTLALEHGETPIQMSLANTIPAASRLCLNSRLYDIQTEPANEDGSALRVTFIERDEPTAEAILEGLHVRRLLLDGPVSVVVDHPQTAFRLPPGTYRSGRIILAGEHEDDGIYEARLRRLTIEDNPLNTLSFGGPLNHAVNIRRSGSRLILDYRLHGIGDEEYSRMVRDRRERPGVTILCRGEQVASGSFEYG